MAWKLRGTKSFKIFLILLAVVVPAFLFIWNGVRIQEILMLNSDEDSIHGIQRRHVFTPSKNPVVPEYVHYVWTQTEGQSEFQFHNLLSVLSVQKYLQPKVIMFHILAERMFLKGKAWDKVKRMDNIKVVLRTYFRPRVRNTDVHRNPQDSTDWTIFGKNVTDSYHQSILCRLKALIQYGGIYLDNDVIIMDSMDRLYYYDFTIGKDMACVSPAIILSRKHAPFVQKWMNTFADYDEDFYRPDETLSILVSQNRDLVYVEKSRFSRRDFSRNGCKTNIFYGNCSHDTNYALKLYYSFYGQRLQPSDVNTMRTTFGEIARTVYYGSPKIQARDHGVPHAAKYVVPNIVHYIWFTPHEFKFHHYLGALGALRIQKPDKIMFHTDAEPDGGWWYDFKQEAGDVLQIVRRDQPGDIFGHPVDDIHHKSDVSRMQVLLEYGGIYLDSDVMIVRNMDPIRKYNYTMGMEIAGLNNGVIFSAPQSAFLKIYYDSYKNFDDGQWNLNSCVEPYRLASEHPDLIHIETSSLSRPQWTDWWDMRRAWRNGALVDWDHSYAIHWIYSYHGDEYNPEQIKTMNTTFGEVARHIYYGKKDIIWDDEYDDYK